MLAVDVVMHTLGATMLAFDGKTHLTACPLQLGNCDPLEWDVVADPCQSLNIKTTLADLRIHPCSCGKVDNELARNDQLPAGLKNINKMMRQTQAVRSSD